MVVPEPHDGPPPDSSRPTATAPANEPYEGVREPEQRPLAAEQPPQASQASPAAPRVPSLSEPASDARLETNSSRQNTPDAPTGPTQANASGNSRGFVSRNDDAPQMTPHRQHGNMRSWMPSQGPPPAPDSDTVAPDSIFARTQGAISTILGRSLFPTMLQPGARSGTVYFISIHDDDRHNKASQAALRRLRTVPLSEIPVDERECTICYEPLEEVPEEALQQQSELAAADAAAEATAAERSEGDASPDRGAEQPAPEPKDGHAPLQLPCKHAFGASCLRNWLQNSSTCPLCRKSIEPRSHSGNEFRRHIIHRQEDFDRLWASIMRPHPEQNANGDGAPRGANAEREANRRPSDGVATDNGADNNEEPQRAGFPLDFNEIASELSRHAERHLRERHEQQPNNGASNEGERQQGDQEAGQQQQGPDQEDPQAPRHMHFHFTLDDAFRDNGAENVETAPQEFVFDIRILPQPATFNINSEANPADGNAAGPRAENTDFDNSTAQPPRAATDEGANAEGSAPNLPQGGVDLAALRARQHEEMVRAVRAAAEASLANEPPTNPAPESPGQQREAPLNILGRLPRPVLAFRPAPTALRPGMSPRSVSEGPEQSSSATSPREATRVPEASSEEPPRPNPPGVVSDIVSRVFRRSNPTPSDEQIGVRSPLADNRDLQIPSPRPGDAMAVDRTPSTGPEQGDTSIDERLFQAFRRHFDAPETPQEILVEQLNERLPPPESQTDAMLVDSDSSRSVTPSADAPSVDQSDDTDMSRSGPTRRPGRRRHPYPRS